MTTPVNTSSGNQGTASATAFLQAMLNTHNTAYTENGALSHAKTGSARVDLYFKAIRKITESNLYALLDASWKECPLDTMRIMFNKRDCRGGAGEKEVFNKFLRWMIERNYTSILLSNIHLIPEYGYWKSLLVLMNTPLEPIVLQLFAEQLIADRAALTALNTPDTTKADKSTKSSISLAAKWAPRENQRCDKKSGFVRKICRFLGCSPRAYRKEFLVPLSAHLDVVERKMCQKDWDKITYEHVPSVCMLRHKKAFKRNDAERYGEFCKKLVEGKTKVNSSQLYPHDIVKKYIDQGLGTEDPLLEAQWKGLIDKLRADGVTEAIKDCLVLSDVSGSMAGEPMMVSYALGLLISELSDKFHNQVITFETKPKFAHITGTTLNQRIRQISDIPWGGTTDFRAVFDLIFKQANKFGLKPEDMPKRLVVLSDMQFNQADSGNRDTNYDNIRREYGSQGYPMPQIVFWNLRANTHDFPAEANTASVAMLSGFSPSCLNAILRGEIPDSYTIMRCIIDAERYAPVNINPDLTLFTIADIGERGDLLVSTVTANKLRSGQAVYTYTSPTRQFHYVGEIIDVFSVLDSEDKHTIVLDRGLDVTIPLTIDSTYFAL